MRRATAARQRGLSAWCRIYREADPGPDKGAGHRVASGDTYPGANESACHGRASGDGDSGRENDK